MAFIKLLSLNNNWPIIDALRKTAKTLNVNEKCLEDISLIHIEELECKYNARIMADMKFINRIKKGAEKLKNGNGYILTRKNLNLKFQVVEKKSERFITEKIPENNNKRNLVLLIKMQKDDSLMSIMDMIGSKVKINYVSRKGNNCYVYLQDLQTARKVKNLFQNLQYQVRFANTIMLLERILNKSKQKEVCEKKISTRRDDRKEKMNEIDNNKPTYSQEIQNTVMANNPYPYFNNLPPIIIPNGMPALQPNFFPSMNMMQNPNMGINEQPNFFPTMNMIQNPNIGTNNMMIDLSRFNITLTPKYN